GATNAPSVCGGCASEQVHEASVPSIGSQACSPSFSILEQRRSPSKILSQLVRASPDPAVGKRVQVAAQIRRRLLPPDPSPHLGPSPQRRFDLICDGLLCTSPAPSHPLLRREVIG
ncbi:hypothetical protein EJB05_15669, partial [Eragrostis curvula]